MKETEGQNELFNNSIQVIVDDNWRAWFLKDFFIYVPYEWSE